MNGSLSRAVATTAVLTIMLLIVPLVAMQFTSEVNWGIEDFVAAGVLLFGAGITYWLFTRYRRSAVHRLAVAALVLAAFGVIWAELAVGLFS